MYDCNKSTVSQGRKDILLQLESDINANLEAQKRLTGLDIKRAELECKILGPCTEQVRRTIKRELKQIQKESDELTQLCAAELIPEIFPRNGRVRAIGGGRKSYPWEYRLTIQFIIAFNYQTYGSPTRIGIYNQHLTLADVREILVSTYGQHGLIDPLTGERMSDGFCDEWIRQAFEELGITQQKCRKLEQVGASHPDRDLQFQYIKPLREAIALAKNGIAMRCLALGPAVDVIEQIEALSSFVLKLIAYGIDPVISMDSMNKVRGNPAYTIF